MTSDQEVQLMAALLSNIDTWLPKFEHIQQAARLHENVIPAEIMDTTRKGPSSSGDEYIKASLEVCRIVLAVSLAEQMEKIKQFNT